MSDADNFINSLTVEQKALFMKALVGEEEVKPATKKPATKKRAARKPAAKKTATKRRKRTVKKKPTRVVNEDFTVNRDLTGVHGVAGRVPVKAKDNNWSDNGRLGKTKKTKTPDYTPVPRERSEPEILSLVCHVCSRKFEQHADVLYGKFPRCIKCSAG